MLLPVRVELLADDMACRFTVADAEFVVAPARGDLVVFQYDGWPEPVHGAVSNFYHYAGQRVNCLVLCQCALRDYDHLIEVFDRFKASARIVDLDMENRKPPPYYAAYRTLAGIWGKDDFKFGVDNPTALAETVRAVYLAGGGTDRKLDSNVRLLHQLIIEDREKRRGDAIGLLPLIRQWDQICNYCSTIAGVDCAQAAIAAARRLTSFKSIGPDQWPVGLRSVMRSD